MSLHGNTKQQWVDMDLLLMFFRVVSLALGQSYDDCPSASETALEMGKIKSQLSTNHMDISWECKH